MKTGSEHKWVSPILGAFDFDATVVDLTVDPVDEMFEQSVLEQSGDLDGGTAAYFGSGAQIGRTVERLGLSSLSEDATVLDFGCGFGRVTRFLVSMVGSERVWVSDIVDAAVEFQQRQFGCSGFDSHADPAGVDWPDLEFDLVYVGSLFTHLPEHTFQSWLEALFARVREGGRLLFSVHDEALKPDHIVMPESGLAFVASSEARSIEHEVYGSTWVRGSFVEDRIGQLSGGQRPREGKVAWRRYPRALCGYQDLIEVRRDGASGADQGIFSDGAAVVAGVGQLETAELIGSKYEENFALEVGGWVLQTGAAESLQVARTGQVSMQLSSTGESVTMETDATDLREDLNPLAAGLGSDAGRPGFSCRLTLPTEYSRGNDLLLIMARWPSSQLGRSVQHLLYAGSVDRLLYLVADEHSRRRRDRVFELAETIEQVKKSRFWQARRAWFGFKRRLGLTEEDANGPVLRSSDRRPPDSV